MKKLYSYWLPDNETHFSEFLNRYAKWGRPAEYQYEVRNKAMELVENFDVSIDIGANLGLWSQSLEKRFEKNFCIEPIADFVPYLQLNAPDSAVINTALGSRNGLVKMTRDFDNVGRNSVQDQGDFQVSVQRLDDLELPPADFIKIDVEGYELEVLLGGKNYIEKSWPVLVVEQEHKTSGAKQLLLSWGYTLVDSVKHDYIYKMI
jgi:FkbM family methyltransferase